MRVLGSGVACAAAISVRDASATLAIVDLGQWPGATQDWAGVAGMSADGAVIVGSDEGRAFRWDGSLHEIAGAKTASAANADGSIIVGTTSAERAFRWSNDDGLQDLGTVAGGTGSEALGVSADGSIVVGRATTAAGSVPWIWGVGGGMRSLGALDGATSGSATAVSRDGTVVVGSSGNRAFRWTVDGGMQDISPPLSDTGWAAANAVSADGEVVVGWYSYATGVGVRPLQFRWSGSEGFSDLPSEWGATSPGSARAADEHATHIYGRLFMALIDASVWSRATGTVKLADVLQAEGLDLAGWTLMEAVAASDDGDVVAGIGTRQVGDDVAYLSWRVSGINSVGPIFTDGFDAAD
ncbi:MAG TPA: hypothetical protein VFS55_15355 [Dokdonella sp.]|nr:hypothetical protein [Dokdonella sp.]